MSKYDINEKAVLEIEKKKAYLKYYNECLKYEICPTCSGDLKTKLVHYDGRWIFGRRSKWKTTCSNENCGFVKYVPAIDYLPAI